MVKWSDQLGSSPSSDGSSNRSSDRLITPWPFVIGSWVIVYGAVAALVIR